VSLSPESKIAPPLMIEQAPRLNAANEKNPASAVPIASRSVMTTVKGNARPRHEPSVGCEPKKSHQRRRSKADAPNGEG
jgi:hypothetical protein